MGRSVRELVVIAEGRTEIGVVDELLAPHLLGHNVRARAVLPGKPGHRGGARRWASTKREILAQLHGAARRGPGRVTTMFDYYGMPMDWPGREQSTALPVRDRADFVEAALVRDIANDLSDSLDKTTFVPYVQLHELEALLFADIRSLAFSYPDHRRALQHLHESVSHLQPEEIDDGPATAPSKRIAQFVPEYPDNKVSVARSALTRLGLPALRARCPHFDSWITRLESLATAPPNS